MVWSRCHLFQYILGTLPYLQLPKPFVCRILVFARYTALSSEPTKSMVLVVNGEGREYILKLTV